MYAYALICYLDKKSEDYFKKIWVDLNENNITSYGLEFKDRRPHITIADYDNLDKPKFIDSLNKFYSNKSKIDITLNVLGTFINSGTLFISPVFSKELNDFHNNHHTYFKSFNDNENSFYLPGKWNPHCTIASRLSEDTMIKAFSYCSNYINKIDGNISEIALIEVQLNDNGVAIKDSILFLKELI